MGTLWVGWRLLVGKGGGLRQAVLIAFGVTIASALLFSMAAIPGAMSDRQSRDDLRDWLTSGARAENVQDDGTIAIGTDRVGVKHWTHLLVAPGKNATPVVDLPGTGEVWISPALRDVIAANPELSDRLSGEVTGITPTRMLLEPGELVSIENVDPVLVTEAGRSRSLPTTLPPQSDVTISPDVVLVVSIGIVVLALPVVIFISSATQLGVERRRALARALSLAGAETRQIRAFVMLEALSASTLGVVLGYGGFRLARPLLAHIQVGGRTTFSAALTPHPALILAVASFVLLAAVVASLSGTRRVGAGSLEARPVRSARLSGLLLSGLGVVGLALGASSPTNTDAPHPLALLGMILLAVGLALVGQIVISAIGRRVAARTRHGVTLFAARRMDQSPAELYRPLTAVVTGVFVVTAFFTITGTLLKSSNYRYNGIPENSVLIEASPPSLPELAQIIDGHPGVQAVATLTFVGVATEKGDTVGVGIVADCAAIQEVVEVVMENCTGGVFAAPDSTLTEERTVIISTPPFSDRGIETTLSFGGDRFMGAFPTALIIDSDLVQSEFTDQATVGQVVASFDPTTGDIESLRTSVVSAFPTAQVRSITEIEYDQSVSSTRSSRARRDRTYHRVGDRRFQPVGGYGITSPAKARRILDAASERSASPTDPTAGGPRIHRSPCSLSSGWRIVGCRVRSRRGHLGRDQSQRSLADHRTCVSSSRPAGSRRVGRLRPVPRPTHLTHWSSIRVAREGSCHA